MKIPQYFSALEALVSTSHSELSHQVAERVACLLMEPGDGRIETFNKLKQGYALRSQAIHGASFKERKFELLKATCMEIDEICRLILQHVSTNEQIGNVFGRPDEELTDFFQKLVLGGHLPTNPGIDVQ